MNLPFCSWASPFCSWPWLLGTFNWIMAHSFSIPVCWIVIVQNPCPLPLITDDILARGHDIMTHLFVVLDLLPHTIGLRIRKSLKDPGRVVDPPKEKRIRLIYAPKFPCKRMMCLENDVSTSYLNLFVS